MGRTSEPEGLQPGRAVQIITSRRAGAGRRGSGYRVSAGVVLTAAHVVGDATSVQVRFVMEDGGVREVPGEPVWMDFAVDVALLEIAEGPSAGGGYAAETAPVRFGRVARVVDCEALGFPRFRLRRGVASPGSDVLTSYRDTHHALGQADPLAYLRRGTLEISRLQAPEYDPDPNRSPWEGMSGAAVWSGGCLIGIISEHQRSDGLGRLTASPVSLWYKSLTPERIGELADLTGLPLDPDGLDELPRSSAPQQPVGLPELLGAAEKPNLRAAAGKFVEAVYGQWDDEERRRRVHDPRPLAVRYRLTDRPVSDHWANIRKAPPGTDPGPLPLAGWLGGIVRKYLSIPSRRLVVLGAAGSGKTILTMRFVLDWLEARVPGRIPVIFGLVSWNPKTTSLRDWMRDQLVRDHPGLAAPDPDAPERDLAHALIDADWLLPVFDGFDEIAKGLQDRALTSLNATKLPFLLTSRPKEYARAVADSDVLTGAAVVELDDLTLSDLADYLPRSSRPGEGGGLHNTVWAPVLDALHAQPRSPGADNLAKVFTTPLMVAMARTIYSDTAGREPSDLLDTTDFDGPDALRKHLLAAFTPAAYDDGPAGDSRGSGHRGRRKWDRNRAEHWLGYLATHLVQRRTYNLAWWQLGTTTISRPARILMIAFLAALSFGVPTAIGNLPVDLIGTHYGLGFAVERGLVVGLLHGLVAGLGFGCLYAFVSRRAEAKPSRVRVKVFSRTRENRGSFLRRFMVGVAFGTPGALALVLVDRGVVEPIGLGDGLDGGPAGAVLFVLVVGLGIGLVLSIMAWLEVPSEITDTVSPSVLLNENRRNVLFQMLVSGLVFGIPAGIGVGLMDSPAPGLGEGLVVGLLAGLVFAVEAAFAGGFGYGLSFTAWGQWVALSRIWLPLTGRLPWALISFLDDACERGVLRQAGAVYQFRHAELRDHLAQTYSAREQQRTNTPSRATELVSDASAGRPGDEAGPGQ
ncbi:NACHT domain-containing protein [Streptomyces sp. NPDC000151]|uniref:NACHT domain-containing protein n=1 Tax=Streptomyces sp. NPDC000151 TaxID=3154244 RepID=UPI00331B3095